MSDAIRSALDELEKSGRIRTFFATVRRRFFSRARYFFPWCRQADLDDSLQEALLAVFDTPDNLRIDGQIVADAKHFERALEAYVSGAALKQLISRLRILGKDSIRLPSLHDLMEDGAQFDKLLFDLGAVVPGADVAAQWSHKRTIVERCIAKLTDLARRTFMLALSGYKDVEIQQITESGSAVSVRRRISETRSRVVECVSAASGGEV